MKKMFIALICLVHIMLTGCAQKSGENAFQGDRFLVVEDNFSLGDGVTIVVDTETGVQYLWVRSGYRGGLSPLLDQNGMPIILQDCVDNKYDSRVENPS